MKIRVSATALLLSLALPAVLPESHWSPFAESVALAQGATDQVTEVARQRFAEGVKAFDAGKFEEARGAFLQAYALKRNPVLLLNLGQAELKSNHPEDAGNHLQQFLHEVPNASADQKASADKGIADAKKKAAFVVVIVDANQADVSIDGTLIGKAPLLDPFFVKPGKHTVVASFGGKDATTTVDAKSGSATAANITLGTTGAAATAPTPALPTPTPTPTASSTPPAPTPLAPTAPPSSDQPAPFMAPTGGPAPGADATTGEREPFFDWYKHKPIAWAGTGVAGVGLILGIAFSASASSASASETTHSDAIKVHAATDPKTNFGSLKPCGSETQAGNDISGYETACDALRSDISAHNTDVALAVTGWVLLGVGAVGTAAYAMLDWYPKKAPASDHPAKVTPTWQAVPVVSSRQQGLSIVGTF